MRRPLIARRGCIVSSAFAAAVFCCACSGGAYEGGDGAPPPAASSPCSLIRAISVNPASVPVGAQASVSASVTDPSSDYAWSATSGFFDSATSPMAHFTCTVPGQAVVTLELTDAECRDHASAFIMCN